ncbi:PLP-dependent aminotransferase family protein [Microbacterium awajiense]|uniref:PLP-dependent aminotransferase family protein n=1 Tax=Microbacterium awajiense TaxID=415214 RepID=A0ABP7A7T3_9MICO
MDSRVSARALTSALGGWRTREPAYEALADGIRVLCVDNRLAPGTTLPAERELAAALGLSRSTVAAAYESLRGSAHIRSLRGSGSVTLPLRRHDPGLTSGAPDAIDLQQASPPAWPGLAGVFTEVAQSAATLVAGTGYDMHGSTTLRSHIADRYTARGLPTRPDEVLITNGAQSALHLLAAVLVGRGDRVLVETPTYPHAAEAMRAAGGRLIGVPVTTSDGWDLDRAEQAFARGLPVLAYLMPDFQNPTGRTMTAADAARIDAAARRTGSILVLDETTADLDIDRASPGHAFDPVRRTGVVRVGSLGKSVWGGLRLGWIRCEEPLVRRLMAARPVRDLGSPDFEQAVAATVLERFGDVLAQRAHVLGASRDALRECVTARIPEWRVPCPDGGVALWIELDAPFSAALVMDARARGVLLSAGARFGVDGGYDRHLRLPFTTSPERLAVAVDRLADSWARVKDAAPRTAPVMDGALV